MSYQEDLLMLGHREASMLSDHEIRTRIESTMTKTFAWVAAMLLLAFGTARSMTTGLLPLPVSPLLYLITAIGGFGLILFMSWKWQTLSFATLSSLLIVFALLEGYGLSGVFTMYSLGSIQQVFLTTTIMFVLLAGAGWWLKVDITRVGSLLFIALLGLIIGSIVNIFRVNSQFDFWLSLIGIVIFSGFIIYDINVLKQQALINDERIPALMALGLFINFINIFLFLLRIVGNRD